MRNCLLASALHVDIKSDETKKAALLSQPKLTVGGLEEHPKRRRDQSMPGPGRGPALTVQPTWTLGEKQLPVLWFPVKENNLPVPIRCRCILS